jgi:hypothetical protein
MNDQVISKKVGGPTNECLKTEVLVSKIQNKNCSI